MFGWFRSDPLTKLKKQRDAKYREAKEAEKYGDRARQAALYAEAEALQDQVEALEAEQAGAG